MSISTNQPATSSGVNQRLMSRTQNTSAAGLVDFNNLENSTSETTGAVRIKGGIGVAKDLFVKGLSTLAEILVSKVLRLGIEINTTLTGEDAELNTYTAPIVILKNDELVSITNIGLATTGKFQILINRTGNIVILKPGNFAIEDNYPMEDNSMLLLIRSSENNKWHLMSGGGGAGVPNGGTTDQVLMKNSATDGDVSWKGLPGLFVSPSQELSNGETAEIADKRIQKILVFGDNDGDEFLLPVGHQDGDILFVEGEDDFYTAVLKTSGNVLANGTIVFQKYTIREFHWKASITSWIIVGGY